MQYILLFLTILPLSLYAHPHTFVDLYPKISHKQNVITTLHMVWKFDEMTSQLLLMEFDQNSDNKIDDAENRFIKDTYFNTLQDYSFYTYIQIDNKRISINPKNFKVYIDKDSRVMYAFDIEINTDKNRVFIDFYDEDNFTAFMLKKEFVNCDIFFKITGVDKDFYYASRLEFKE